MQERIPITRMKVAAMTSEAASPTPGTGAAMVQAAGSGAQGPWQIAGAGCGCASADGRLEPAGQTQGAARNGTATGDAPSAIPNLRR